MDALASVNSLHFDLETDTGGKPVGGSFSLISAKGDAARPDTLSATVQAALGGFTASLQYVSVGDKHFMTDPLSRQWVVVPAQFNTVAAFSPEQGAPAIIKNLQDLQKQGTAIVDNALCYDFTGTANPADLQSLLGGAAATKPRVEVWAGVNDYLVRQIRLNGPIFQGDPDGTVRTLKFSNFNQNVNIVLPSPGTTASATG